MVKHGQCPACKRDVTEFVVTQVYAKIKGVKIGVAMTMECPHCRVVLGTQLVEQEVSEASAQKIAEKVRSA